MEKHRDNSTGVGTRYVILQMVGAMLTAILAVALMAGGAFAHSGEADASRSIRAEADPSMDVARWYAPIEASSALLASRALNRDANPSMDVARWYAPIEANGALLANRALHWEANPSMNVALWYAPVQSDFEVLLCLADSAGEICQ